MMGNPMQILYAAQLTFPPDWRMPEHRHDNFTEIIIPIGGAMETWIGGQTIVARPGCVMMYPLGESHAERSISRQPVRMLYFAFVGHAPPGTPYMRSLPDRRCEFMGRWMLEVSDAPSRVLMLQLLVHHYTQTSEDDPTVAAVKVYVREHLADPIALADLAAVAGISPFHFARRFRASTGVSPMRYVRQQRVEAARGMLLTSPMPLRSIAAVVGFRDEFELSRVFKRETGASPRQTRRP
jgi:AraC-like DNA-binding protein